MGARPLPSTLPPFHSRWRGAERGPRAADRQLTAGRRRSAVQAAAFRRSFWLVAVHTGRRWCEGSSRRSKSRSRNSTRQLEQHSWRRHPSSIHPYGRLCCCSAPADLSLSLSPPPSNTTTCPARHPAVVGPSSVDIIRRHGIPTDRSHTSQNLPQRFRLGLSHHPSIHSFHHDAPSTAAVSVCLAVISARRCRTGPSTAVSHDKYQLRTDKYVSVSVPLPYILYTRITLPVTRPGA